MIEAIDVTLWGEKVAALAWDTARGFAVTEFYDSFAKTNWDIAPLMMPIDDLNRGERIFTFPSLIGKTFKGLPGFLADVLPDDYGNSIIDEWFAAQGRFIEVNPLDRLCYIGNRGMGALEFEPHRHDDFLSESTALEINELVRLAGLVLNERQTFQINLQKRDKSILDILKVGTSAGGAKPKAIIAYNESTKEVRSGQVKAPDGFTYWLLKFDGVADQKLDDNPAGYGRIEYSYYKMALDCGIEMSESRLLGEGDQVHFMTKRFDRTDAGDKIYMQTLCGIAHYDRDHRYSYEQLFDVMRRLHLNYPEKEQMFRRVVFNIVARNHDDHTKNHTFLMNFNGKWVLAPAYDLCYSYSPTGIWTQRHQMSLRGKRDGFEFEDLIHFGKQEDINDPQQIIQQVVETVANWPKYASDIDVKKDFIEQIDQNLRLLKK